MRINEPAGTETQNLQETWYQYNGKNGQCPVTGSGRLAEGEKAFLKTRLRHHVEQSTLKGWDSVSQEAVHALSQKPTHCAVSLSARIHDPECKGGKWGSLLSLSHLTGYLIPISAAVMWGLETSIPKEGTLPPGCMNLNMRTPSGHLGLFCHWTNWQGKWG